MQKGSKSKGMNLADVAKLHGMTAQELMPQLRKGIKHEYEHTSSKQVARRTALDHLVEFPDDKGGEIENLIDQGEIELKVYPTTPKHANLYGLKSENPLYIQSIFISENQRLKGIGKKVLKYLNDFAIKNGHDVMFGHITQKASFSKDDSRESNLDDVDMIKNWLQSNGYEICESNNDFYKVVNNPDIRFELGGMTYREYVNTQFDENEDRYLPSDFLGDFEIATDKKNLHPILYRTKNGYEYRLRNNTSSSIGVFDGDKMIGYADDKAIMVEPSYQKKGIGLELVTILKERNPNHRFGSMTPAGWNLLGKYYDQKIAKKSNYKFDKGGRTIAQTPAPLSERIYGSKTNPKGSASDETLAKSIKFNDRLEKAIENKVNKYNEEHPTDKVRLSTAKAIVRRGMGAYSKSHRPTISGGMPNSRQAWGLARLNKFLKKKSGLKVKSAYVQDDDLLKYAKGGKTNQGDCYQVTGRIALDNSEKAPNGEKYMGTPKVVHGEVEGQGKIEGLRYGHAWIEDNVYVYDFSNGRDLMILKEIYYYLGKVKQEKPKLYKYTFKEARNKMLESGHFGSWDLITESGL